MFRNSLIQKYVEAYSKYYIYDSIADGFMQTDVCMHAVITEKGVMNIL